MAAHAKLTHLKVEQCSDRETQSNIGRYFKFLPWIHKQLMIGLENYVQLPAFA